MSLSQNDIDRYRHLINNSSYVTSAIKHIAEGLIEGEIKLQGTKYCSRCDCYLPEDAFYNNTGRRKCYWCKKCRGVYVKERKNKSLSKT